MTVASRKTRVRPARRIERASSLGVFWRCAPSTRLIIRSRKVSPGLAVIRITSWSETTVVPPGHARADVGAGLLEDGRRLAGDRGLVHVGHALDRRRRRTGSSRPRGRRRRRRPGARRCRRRRARPQLVAAMGDRDRARAPERRRLGTPAGLGDGLRVRREQDGEPEPGCDLDVEPELRLRPGLDGTPASREHDDERDEDRRELDDEHHGVVRERAAGRACGAPAAAAARRSAGSRTPRGRGGSASGLRPPSWT